MKMYEAQTGSWKENIRTVEVEKSNDISVWIDGRRKAKRSDWKNYFETFEQAKSFLLTDAKTKINEAKTRLDSAEKEFERLQNINP